MKKFTIVLIAILATTNLIAQEFDKNLASARTAYTSGNLQDARFAMEQMLRDLDMAIGREILKMLPAKLGALAANEKEDNLSGAGAMGLYVDRSYGAAPKNARIEIINNSPLLTGINAILSMPVLGGMMTSENQKTVKVQGYKALLNKTVNSETQKIDWDLQIPINNTLFNVKGYDCTETELMQWASLVPLQKISQMAQ
jgi:hypothetical protein